MSYQYLINSVISKANSVLLVETSQNLSHDIVLWFDGTSVLLFHLTYCKGITVYVTIIAY